MSRYSRLDTDEERLPEGFQRIGYDADTQVYTYRDAAGTIYEGAEGASFGELHPVGSAPSGSHVSDDLSKWRTSNNREAWRYMFPFFLLVVLFLLVVWKLLTPSAAPTISCDAQTRPYEVVAGDSCWDIAQSHRMTLEELQEMNPVLKCDPLSTGIQICVPQV
jgi:hypothetical protein